MAESESEYRNIPEEDRKKAAVFFNRGQTVAGTGQFEYAIEMYLSGLKIDPEAVEAHQSLRDISLKRKASGGKNLGMFERMGLKKPTKDDKENMLNAEKLLSYDPGDTDAMVLLIQNAHRAGFFDTVMWIGAILQKANAESSKPEANKFLILKDIYRSLKRWKLAADACHYAAMLRPDDMDLQTELKNLGAQQTMTAGKYDGSGSFRDSVRDAEGQRKLMEADKDIRSVDGMRLQIESAEKEHRADPGEIGKFMKWIEAMVKTEDPEWENKAIEELEKMNERTKSFRFRQAMGKIMLAQLVRMERSLRANVQANPTDPAARQEYAAFIKEKNEKEYNEYKLWAENYPTDTTFRFNMAVRLFNLERYDEAIPVLQQSQMDPKFKFEAKTYLGRAFLEAKFAEEAWETLKGCCDEYHLKGDPKSKEMFYWLGRAGEAKGDNPAAIKAYSQVAQWDFNYRDVQVRIKKLRAV